MRMRVLAGSTLAALTAAVFAGSASPTTTLCVGAKPGCFPTIEAALVAAHDDDVIFLGPGTFAGGIVIDKSVKLVGTSAASSVIAGGGPVLTIGRFGGENEALTVGLSRLTITGGFNDSQPSGSVVAGGGIWIPASAGNHVGATVSIDNSIIAGNQVTASVTIPPGGFSCNAAHTHPCAFVTGGGIDNAGLLTLTDSRVDRNIAGAGLGDTSPASYAAGGGIENHPRGTLILHSSTVSDNRAAVVTPNGAFTDGGGIADGGALTLESSVVSDNVSTVTAAVPSFFPFDVEVEANAGGLYLADGSSTTIRSSRISGNAVIASNAAGDLEAESGGIDSDGSLFMADSSVDHNTAGGSVPANSGFLAEGNGGGIQVQGVTILRSSRVVGNGVSSTSASGTAYASGGGFFNLGADLTLEHSLVVANNAAATGVGGVNLGGGIANVQFFGPAPQLTVANSVITANRLSASPGVASQGGGVFTLEVTSVVPFETGNPFHVALTHTRIEGNQPDECAGC